MELFDYFQKYPKVAVAFSGGVDSAYLLYASKQYAETMCAYYVKSSFQPRFETEDAYRFVKEIGVELKVVEIDILEDEKVTLNSENRCYYCKKRMFEAIRNHAKEDGFDIVIDGTNASDDIKERPGFKAIGELSIMSPLRLCGLTKEDIRNLSHKAGLFTFNKPAYACLATRIPTGNKITEDKLKRTEMAEEYLASLGFSDFRIRFMDGAFDAAKIQVPIEQFKLVVENRERIVEELKQYYSEMYLDLEGRNEN